MKRMTIEEWEDYNKTPRMPIFSKNRQYTSKYTKQIYYIIPCKIADKPELKYRVLCEAFPHLDSYISTDDDRNWKTYSEVYNNFSNHPRG